MMKLDTILSRARDLANSHFSDFPAEIEKKLSLRTPEEAMIFLKRTLSFYISRYELQVFYDVRNENELKDWLKTALKEKELPFNRDKKGFPLLSGTNEEKLYFLLWNQYLRLKKIEYLKRKISEPENLKKAPARLQAFSWTGSSEQLNKLYDGLIYYGFIDPQTDFKDFAAIFSGQVIDNNLLPVTWIKKTHKSKFIAKSAVVNLFEILAEKNLIPADELQNKAEFFRKLQACFSDPAGNSMKFEHKHLGYSKEFATLLRQIVTSL